MNQVKQVTVSGRTFNVAQAPAVEQKSLLLLIGNKIMLRAQATRTQIDTDFLFGALMSLSEPDFDKLCGIVLRKTFELDSKVAVDVGAFQGDMTGFFRLVAEAVAVNLDDFFTFVNSQINVPEADDRPDQ